VLAILPAYTLAAFVHVVGVLELGVVPLDRSDHVGLEMVSPMPEDQVPDFPFRNPYAKASGASPCVFCRIKSRSSQILSVK
jgi:hypothetical protein